VVVSSSFLEASTRMIPTPTSGTQNGCHGNTGCLAMGPRNLKFMIQYFNNTKFYKLQNTCNIFNFLINFTFLTATYLSEARYSLFMLKVPLNPNQSTNSDWWIVSGQCVCDDDRTCCNVIVIWRRR